MTTRVEDMNEAARALCQHGFAIIKLPEEVRACAGEIFAAGRRFFEETLARKQAQTRGRIEGYRGLGVEKDAATSLPDLSESYTCWFRELAETLDEVALRNNPLREAMRRALPEYAALADRVLAALAREVAPRSSLERAPLEIRDVSYLQINYSRPVEHARDRLMEAHEDGHLLTILTPTQTGLRVCPGELVSKPTKKAPAGVFRTDQFEPIEIGRDEAVLVPSSPTFYLTGGHVSPLFHLVNNDGQVVRQSLMFFVNPTPGSDVTPWVRNEISASVDIHQVVEGMSSIYGLPSIAEADAFAEPNR